MMSSAYATAWTATGNGSRSRSSESTIPKRWSKDGALRSAHSRPLPAHFISYVQPYYPVSKIVHQHLVKIRQAAPRLAFTSSTGHHTLSKAPDMSRNIACTYLDPESFATPTFQTRLTILKPMPSNPGAVFGKRLTTPSIYRRVRESSSASEGIKADATRIER
ncbi:hypothetical protein EVAR_93790_1 [Eumeta japonica]|uniref:Uncharacterized protein n=1 Tax=Eumeta variegata TaxID=151549 RepID=A0A4C1VCU8_EUMVA|nr:hypothetical protein EVAR_93790_1 [Eumeta japonica]